MAAGMRTLSLFSGIGGLDLGLERAGFEIIAQCEADPFCRAVLEKHWPGVPCWKDVRELVALLMPLRRLPRALHNQARAVRELLRDLFAVVGGFPCQDISVAGKGAGIEEGWRSGLWRLMRRVIAVVRPCRVITENVPALRTRGYDRVAGDLERIGYTVTPLVVGAEHVGAPHKRHRVFCVAYRNGKRASEPKHTKSAISRENTRLHTCRRGGRSDSHEMSNSSSRGTGEIPARSGQPGQATCNADGAGQGVESERLLVDVPGMRIEAESSNRVRSDPMPSRKLLGDTQQPRLEGLGADAGESQEPQNRNAGACRWPAGPGQPQHDWEEPRLAQFEVGSEFDGVPVRLVRFANKHALRAYGNAVVPQVAELIGRAVIRAHKGTP